MTEVQPLVSPQLFQASTTTCTDGLHCLGLIAVGLVFCIHAPVLLASWNVGTEITDYQHSFSEREEGDKRCGQKRLPQGLMFKSRTHS